MIHIRDRIISPRHVVSWVIRQVEMNRYELQVYTTDGSRFDYSYGSREAAEEDDKMITRMVLDWENRQY